MKRNKGYNVMIKGSIQKEDVTCSKCTQIPQQQAI